MITGKPKIFKRDRSWCVDVRLPGWLRQQTYPTWHEAITAALSLYRCSK
jgi:hypothetical protein